MYAAESTRAKLELIASILRRLPRSAAALQRLEHDLLFLRAFPDTLAVRDAAIAALGHVASRVRTLRRAQRRQLDDSGMAGSTTRHSFAFGIARWLADSGEQADIDWDAFDAPERLDPLLRLALVRAETDAFDSGELSTRDWLTLARGSREPRALAWIARSAVVQRIGGRSAADDESLRLLYEATEPPVRWRPSLRRSTSGNAVDATPLVPRAGLRGTPRDPALHVTTPLAGIERLSPSRAEAWLDASRAALAARCREVHAITYANRDEVYLADLGEGTALCLIGAARGDRLTLEANYGYVLFGNGVPIGYGGVTPLAAQANTGINIFDPFRHGEASMLFAQALRAFHTLFGVTRFIVNPYQFGAGNDEALASGAYWFYDRLGFRPVSPAARALAGRERRRLAASRKHRSSLRTLRALASDDLVLQLPSAGAVAGTPLFDERGLVSLARAVTESLAASDMAARLQRHDALLDSVARTLSLRRWRARSSPLRFGLERLAPVLALIEPEIAAWPVSDRRALVALLRAKGSPQERDFAVQSAQHRALWTALSRRATA